VASTPTAPRRLGEAPGLARARRASELLAGSEAALRRTAKRFSICEDDADDALQRAVEILLVKAPEVEGARLLAWMQVVVRHEALAVRRGRLRLLAEPTGDGSRPSQVFDPDCHPGPGPDPGEALGDRERTAEAARRLRGLKRQERRALGLQAAGCSYAEIQAITGWTYTKVNRCLTEGRARLRSLPLPAD
jgi:DNA-directed RNA polymerase specialized sigma24 family protein